MGSTSTKFHSCFNNHKSRIRAHTRLSVKEKLRDDLKYQHFNSPGHNGLDDISVQLIDRVASGKDLVDKEGQWAYRLKCLKPLGLNKTDFFFSQNRSTQVRKN